MGTRGASVRGALTLRRIRQVLGLLWLSAAALQAQPFLFTTGFAREVIAPNALFEPAVVADPARLATRIIAAHPAAWNLVFVLAELAVGVGLLTARSPRAARTVCVGSIAWALSVWWIGEGAGGLLTGHASLSTGAPGAALLYAAVSVACLPLHETATPAAAVTSRVLTASWTFVWTIGGLLIVLPGQASAVALADQLAMGSMMSPASLSGPERHLALLATRQHQLGGAVTIALAVVYVIVGLVPLLWPARRRLAIRTGLLLAAVFWVAAQGFGGLSTGQATDLGAAPALALIGYLLLRAPAVRETAAPASVRHPEPLLAFRRVFIRIE